VAPPLLVAAGQFWSLAQVVRSTLKATDFWSVATTCRPTLPRSCRPKISPSMSPLAKAVVTFSVVVQSLL
jgi:hypothetical protein